MPIVDCRLLIAPPLLRPPPSYKSHARRHRISHRLRRGIGYPPSGGDAVARSQDLQILASFGKSMLGCEAIPLLGLKIILSYALPVFVCVGNFIFRGRGSMSRGFVQPSQSFWKVLLNDAAFKIEQAQLVLRRTVVLRDRFAIPLHRQIGIDRHASALRVPETQVRLR